MKKASAEFFICWGLVAAAMVVWLATERQAYLKLAQQNVALRQQLSPRDALIIQNRRLSNLLAQAKGFSSRANPLSESPQPTDVTAEEVERLRADVDVLRQQTNEMEILREDTRQARTALETSLKAQSGERTEKAREGTNLNSQLEILKAEYWTDNTRMDVTDELRDRIRGDSLKAVASNNIKGDPDFGRVKHLTIQYQFGGVTMTNEFREGDVIVLPRE